MQPPPIPPHWTPIEVFTDLVAVSMAAGGAVLTPETLLEEHLKIA